MRITYEGRTFEFDLDLFMVLAVERMERYQSTPKSFLYSEYNDDCMLTVFQYLRETDADMDDLDVRPLIMHCAKALKQDAHFRHVVMNTPIRDDDWRNELCPELWRMAVTDFARHFPQYHNMIHAGLLNKEIEIWCADRLHFAGIHSAAFHRMSFAQQRQQIRGVEDIIFGESPSKEMSEFYFEKVEEAKSQIDADGHRNYWG